MAGIQKHIRGLTVAVTPVLFVCCAVLPAVAQESVAVDRWLVSTPFPADTSEDPLGTDYLQAPGEVAVLPDRGRTVAGADWSLIRRDSARILDLETQRAGAEGPVAVYAHAYLKAAGDRTLTLTWGGLDCTGVVAWLNGRSLATLGLPLPAVDDAGASATRQARVRIGRGYNTLLLKAISGNCPFGVTASLGPTSQGSLEGLRVQASRPYGDTRTGPSPWLVTDPQAGPEPVLGWKDKELFGVAGVRLAAFAVTAIEGAKLKARTGGEEVRRELEWLTPAEPETVLMPFSFKSLRRALERGEGLELKLEWSDDEWEGVLSLDPVDLLTAFHSSIRLLGWSVRSGPSGPPVSADGAAIYDSEDEPHPLANLVPLPTAAGTTLLGEWEVPGWLSGFTLGLDVTGAPGEYRLKSVPVDGSEIILCTNCRKGDHIQLAVVTEGAWERFPGVSIVDVEQPAVDGTGQALEWLTLIDEKGSRKYRERGSASGQ